MATDALHPEYSIYTTADTGPLGALSYFQFTYLRAMGLDFLGLAPPVRPSP